jgi:predicted TIM-barrel enzyme
MADVDVKALGPLGVGAALEDEADDVARRGGADALIVSGAAPASDDAAKSAASRGRGGVPSSSLRRAAESLPTFRPHARGVIVGTYFKEAGRSDRPVDPARVRALMAAAEA